jgi:hypothetical protein
MNIFRHLQVYFLTLFKLHKNKIFIYVYANLLKNKALSSIIKSKDGFPKINL